MWCVRSSQYLGGAHNGTRLSKLFEADVDEQRTLELLRPLIHQVTGRCARECDDVRRVLSTRASASKTSTLATL
jgi:hypothetical protein